jgi:SAM-dependent methyltransferase
MPTDAHWDRVFATTDYGRIETPEADQVVTDAMAFFGDVKGKTLLDVGCGAGRDSLFFAGQGATVIAVDTSRVAIEKLAAYCAENGIDNVKAVRASAFDIGSLGPFDLVFGRMILHHIEPFDRFVGSLSELMRAGDARGFFYENSANSGLLMWCRDHLVGRFGIPKHGDDEERPLSRSEVQTLARHLDVEVVYPELFLVRMASPYLFRGHLWSALTLVDRWLFHLKGLRKYSYRQYVYLQPKIGPNADL